MSDAHAGNDEYVCWLHTSWPRNDERIYFGCKPWLYAWFTFLLGEDPEGKFGHDKFVGTFICERKWVAGDGVWGESLGLRGGSAASTAERIGSFGKMRLLPKGDKRLRLLVLPRTGVENLRMRADMEGRVQDEDRTVSQYVQLVRSRAINIAALWDTVYFELF